MDAEWSNLVDVTGSGGLMPSSSLRFRNMRERRAPMGLLGRFKDGFDDGLRRANPKASDQEIREVRQELEKRIRDAPPPSIAIVGEAGVGKSSTINALFNAGVPISHTRACRGQISSCV